MRPPAGAVAPPRASSRRHPPEGGARPVRRQRTIVPVMLDVELTALLPEAASEGVPDADATGVAVDAADAVPETARECVGVAVYGA
jgi:hypothetical protein